MAKEDEEKLDEETPEDKPEEEEPEEEKEEAPEEPKEKEDSGMDFGGDEKDFGGEGGSLDDIFSNKLLIGAIVGFVVLSLSLIYLFVWVF